MFEHPFLYRLLANQRKHWGRNFLLAFVGPILWLAPSQVHLLAPRTLGAGSALQIGTCLYVAFLCLRALAVSVGKVSGERERGTWEVLSSVGFSPGRIALGLWLSLLIPCLFELALALPALVWIHFQQQLQLWQSLALGVLFLGLVTFHCSLGLYCSLRSPTTLKAAQWAYGWVTLWGLMTVLMLGGPLHVSSKEIDFPLCFNPWALALTILKSYSETPPSWLVPGLGFFLLGTLALAHLIGRQVRQQLLPVSTQVVHSRSICKPGESNPLLYRGRYGASPRQTAVSYFLYAAFLVMTGPQPDHGELWLVMVTLGHLGFWILPAVFYPTQAICRERDRGTLDTLLVSRLRGSEILYGICRQTLIPISLGALLLSPFTASLVGYRLESWLLLTAMTQAFLWGSGLGALAISLLSRNTLQAFQRVYLALAFLHVGCFVLDIAFLNPLLNLDRPFFSLVSPLFATLAVSLGQIHPDPEMEAMYLHSFIGSIGLHLAVAGISRAYLLRRLSRA